MSDGISYIRDMIRRIKLDELDRFDQGSADLPPIIQGFEVFLRTPVPWSLIGESNDQATVHVSNLKAIYDEVAAEFEPWMYHKIQLRVREEPILSKVRESIAALRQLLQN